MALQALAIIACRSHWCTAQWRWCWFPNRSKKLPWPPDHRPITHLKSRSGPPDDVTATGPEVDASDRVGLLATQSGFVSKQEVQTT
jgi:hypothetical protein